MVVKIAARQSDLARLQAFEVGRALEKAQALAGGVPLKIEYSFRSSLGDQRADDPLWQMPEKGVFTQDFVQDLKAGVVDVVVHSWKDLPIGPRDGAVIAATLPRADARDVLLVRKDLWLKNWALSPSPSMGQSASSLRSLRPFRVLTSSPRRVYNLTEFLGWALPFSITPEIEFVPVRGNIATRVGKLITPDANLAAAAPDALIVAKAALDRLLTSSRYGEKFPESERTLREFLAKAFFVVLPLSVNPTAAAQGALAIEVRSGRDDILELCKKIDATDDRLCVEEERAELARHGGGCHQKIGVTCLNRPYGRVRSVRGLTDAGLVLNFWELSRKNDPLKFWPRSISPDEICETEMKAVNRRPVDGFVLPDSPQRGFFIARANAWPESGQPLSGFVWAAGLSTWRQLVKKGVWVHGSSESLGETEIPAIDHLAGGNVSWTKLTHLDAAKEEILFRRSGGNEPIGTYKVDVVPPEAESFNGKNYFFWKSGSQFRAALSVGPNIVNGYHASGPGHTHEAIVQELRAASVADDEIKKRVVIFLNESDFFSELSKRSSSKKA